MTLLTNKTKWRGVSVALLGLWALGIPAGCASDGVGDPCIPEDEYVPGFSGFSVDEVNTESRSFQCQSRLCLVNHFQGRVSCPYGQTQTDVDGGNARCTVPDSTIPITAPVAPQLLSRRAEDSVYCSCRCDGPDPSARYCECPSGYVCQELIPRFATGVQLAGSYCVREGTVYNKTALRPADVCDPAIGNCD